MTAYVDASSLIKLYIDEPGSAEVRALVHDSVAVATGVITYPEARSALARLRREGRLSTAEHARHKRQLDIDWLRLTVIAVDDSRCRTAGRLAERHSLRGFDSVHLACYLEVVSRSAPSPVTFSSFDERLNRAARLAARR